MKYNLHLLNSIYIVIPSEISKIIVDGFVDVSKLRVSARFKVFVQSV